MKLRFSIHYRTEWGQQLVALITYYAHDGASRQDRLPMLTEDGDYWSAETVVLESRRSPVEAFSYIYIVEGTDGCELRREWNGVPRLYAFDTTKNYTLDDCWRDVPLPAHLYTSAYQVTVGLTHTDVTALRLPLFRKTVLFRVSAPQVMPHQQVAVIGNHPALGAWNPSRYMVMEPAGQGDWMLTLNVDWGGLPFEYKYVVVDKKKHELVAWEEGENRQTPDELADGDVYVAYGEPLRLAEKPWRAAGVCVPVFALRSVQSCGVGDFGDLYRFIDWAAADGTERPAIYRL